MSLSWIEEKLIKMTPLWKKPYLARRLQEAVTENDCSSFIAVNLLGENGVSESQVLDVILEKNLNHVCYQDSPSFETEIQTSALMLTSPGTFFEKPLVSIFCPEEVKSNADSKFEIWSKEFFQISEKSKTLDEIKSVLEEKLNLGSLAAEILLVIDELFTNAIFNAPFVDLKTKVNPGLNRSDTRTSMPHPNRGRVFIGKHDGRLVVGVRDPFGSLDIQRLFKKIKNCHEDGVAGNMNMGPGGAGIGSYMVYQSSTSYYVAVDEGKSTIVCCAFPLDMSGKKRQSLSKNIHCIQGRGR